MHHTHCAKPDHAARAFTLIEVIVVMTILAIMATMMMPRLTGNDQRQFKLTVEEVGDLLTMYAQRQNLGQKAVGILHDPYRNWLELMVMDTQGSATDHVSAWRRDPFVQPVKLPSFIQPADVLASADGDIIDITEYPLSCEIGQERPRIEISLRGAGESATLSLAAYGVAPSLNSSYMTAGVVREKYDLDAAGRSREDW